MKKLLCVLFALILPALTACGNTAAAPAADNAATTAETSAPAEATEAEALPESCRIWYGAAAQSGAAGADGICTDNGSVTANGGSITPA